MVCETAVRIYERGMRIRKAESEGERLLSKPVKAILHALSYGGVEVEASRRLADIKKLDPMRILCRRLDAEIYNKGYKIPIRLYFASEEAMETVLTMGSGTLKNTGTIENLGATENPGTPENPGTTEPPGITETLTTENPGTTENPEPTEDPATTVDAGAAVGDVLLFFHGGGWVTESVENYDRVCARMAQATGCMVISVEYRLAPEHRFPVGLKDCYAVAKALFRGEIFPDLDPERITVIGDSAGGNLTAAVCMMARDTGDFRVRQQILIYPAVNNCYTEESPFPSVRENGEDYLLTAKKLEDYLNLYQSSPEDRQNPYFAPILAKDFTNLPRTLILTAEYDPLRDEGEAYGKKLVEAGNEVEIHRIPDACHGYFALGIKFLHVQESFEYINHFLAEGGEAG